VHWKYI